MLIYGKKVEDKMCLFGTLGNIPSDSDLELVYCDRDGNVLTIEEGDIYLDAGQHAIKRLSDGKFVDVFVVGEDGQLVNVIPSTVEPPVPTPKQEVGIEIASKPTKLAYEVGEAFNTTGLAVNALFDDDTKEEVTDYTVSPANGFVFEDAGEQTITVTHNGFNATFAVEVSANEPEEEIKEEVE